MLQSVEASGSVGVPDQGFAPVSLGPPHCWGKDQVLLLPYGTIFLSTWPRQGGWWRRGVRYDEAEGGVLFHPQK
jgi:hypothetical protein